MATTLKNLSKYDIESIPDASQMRFGIVVAEWNSEITMALLNGVNETLLKLGCSEENIRIQFVPGTFELTFAAKHLATTNNLDAIIVIGCVIRGETPHFDYICQGVTQGVTLLNIEYPLPFIYGVLTTNDLQQAKDRCGGKHGNKGVEAAVTAIKMADIGKAL